MRRITVSLILTLSIFLLSPMKSALGGGIPVQVEVRIVDLNQPSDGNPQELILVIREGDKEPLEKKLGENGGCLRATKLRSSKNLIEIDCSWGMGTELFVRRRRNAIVVLEVQIHEDYGHLKPKRLARIPIPPGARVSVR